MTDNNLFLLAARIKPLYKTIMGNIYYLAAVDLDTPLSSLRLYKNKIARMDKPILIAKQIVKVELLKDGKLNNSLAVILPQIDKKNLKQIDGFVFKGVKSVVYADKKGFERELPPKAKASAYNSEYQLKYYNAEIDLYRTAKRGKPEVVEKQPVKRGSEIIIPNKNLTI